jgi:hypothetical protein
MAPGHQVGMAPMCKILEFFHLVSQHFAPTHPLPALTVKLVWLQSWRMQAPTFLLRTQTMIRMSSAMKLLHLALMTMMSSPTTLRGRPDLNLSFFLTKKQGAGEPKKACIQGTTPFGLPYQLDYWHDSFGRACISTQFHLLSGTDTYKKTFV